MATAQLSEIIARICATIPGERDRGFLRRVYQNGLDTYLARIHAIGFEGHASILDAGSGFGQWSLALGKRNAQVTALEHCPLRARTTRAICREADVGNVQVVQGSLDCLPFVDNSFDGIFCYSVLYQTRWRQSLWEMARVLRPGGQIYVCANSWGWQAYNLLTNPNRTHDFSPRAQAFKSVLKTITRGVFCIDGDVVLSHGRVSRALKELGFGVVRGAGEGRLTVAGAVPGPSFYAATYWGMDNVYELLATK